MTRFSQVLSAGLLVFGLGSPVFAQQSVGEGDIKRLHDYVYLAERDLTQLRGTNPPRAEQLKNELDDLRDEVTYLKVKLRKERSLPRADYADLRDRIQDLRARAEDTPAAAAMTPRSTAATTLPPVAPPRSTAPPPARVSRNTVEIPVGTEIDLRLSNRLSSGTAKVEDRVEATTLEDLTMDGRAVVPAGSVVRGVVTTVDAGTRTNRKAQMTVSFNEITANGRTYPLRSTVTEAIESEGLRGEAGRVGVGAGLGGLIGGLLGGFKGALTGILIGGGGTIAATEGKEVELAQGSVLRVRVDSPLEVQYSTGR